MDRQKIHAWWTAKKGEVNQAVIPYVRTVENYQAEMFDKFVKLASTYDVNPRTNRHSSARETSMRLGRSRAIVTENLIATNVDTVAANVADQDIKIRVHTDGADWSHQRMAKKLAKYADGLSELLEVGSKCRFGFKAGAAMKGTGLNKVWIDQFDQIQVTPVPIDNIVVDELECRDGRPRHLHYRDFFDKEDLMAQFPDFADKIERAQTTGGKWNIWAGYRPMQANEVVVIESWRLPIGPKGHERYVAGRHTLSIDGCDLLDEEYHKPRFPFSKMVWNAPIWGFYGISLAERIMPHQNLLNRRNYQINRSLDLKADPVTYVHQADQNLAVKTVNQIGSIAVYKATPPITIDHQAVGQETYASRREIKQDAGNEAGVSSMMQSGGVPSGVETGEAVRQVRMTRSQRFSIQEKGFEQFWLDTVWLIIDCCKDLGSKAPKILHVSKFGNSGIKWSDVDMGDLKIQLSASSTLGDTEAGRQQRLTELVAAGLITPDESREMMDHPDIERKLSLYSAKLEAAENAVERILDGERLTPTPYMDLATCVIVAERTYNMIDIGEDRGGAPEEILEGLSDFMSIAASILNPPQVPGNPANQAAMPMAPGAPGAEAAPPPALAPGSFAPMQV
jgi:hypothetical protein